MSLGSSSFEFKTRLWASAGCAALAAALFALSACGVLSSPERDETPSALMLRAQAAYDSGKYSEAVTLLQELVKKDPSNEEARIRLAFSYNGSIGVTPLNLLKTLASSSSAPSSGGTGNSDITKLTSGAGLSKTITEKIKNEKNTLTSVDILREKFKEFATFQSAFLTLCPLFSKTTLDTLRTKSASAVTLMKLDQCGVGVASSNANVSIAALTLAIDQFATLYKSILDSDGDGQIDAEKDSKDASDSISGLSTGAGTTAESLSKLNSATQKLTGVATTLKGEVFKLAIAQFSIISAVVDGSNLPSTIAAPLKKAVDGLDTAVGQINKYLDAGKATSTSTSTGGAAAQDAAAKANEKAQALLAGQDPTKTNETCTSIYCLRTAYGLSVSNPGDLPNQCSTAPNAYTCTQ